MLDSVPTILPTALRIAPAPPATRFLLRGDPEALGREFGLALPLAPCTAADGDGRTALWLGPDEWLLLVPAGTPLPLWDTESGAAFDITHRQLGVTVEGGPAAAVLAAECPLDFDAMPVGFCSRTVLCKAEIVLWRQDRNRFHVEAWRSFLPYVTGLLEHSAHALP